MNQDLSQKDFQRLLKRAYSIHKAGAKKRGKPSELALEEHSDIIMGSCLYCGSRGSNKLKYAGLELNYNGVDRIDSAESYTKGNSVPCCSFCNSLKGAMIPGHWFDFINSVVLAHADWNHEFPVVAPFAVKPDPTRKSKRYFKGW